MKQILLIAIPVLFVSCVSYFLKGAKLYAGGPPAGAIASFTAKTCTATGTHESMAGPTGTYYLANTAQGPALYEIDETGEGSAITNYWRDAKGHHFAAYVPGHQAWEYVLPDDRSKPGVRKVFLQYSIQHVPGGFRILGEPAATCPLLAPGMAPAPVASGAPVPATAPEAISPEPAIGEGGTPPPDAGLARPSRMLCVPGTTQQCVGSGACKGGQSCLPSGMGFSACDCGHGRK